MEKPQTTTGGTGQPTPLPPYTQGVTLPQGQMATPQGQIQQPPQVVYSSPQPVMVGPAGTPMQPGYPQVVPQGVPPPTLQHAGTNPQQGVAMQPMQQQGQVFQMATPLASLNQGPAPVDCPACGQRGMTAVTYQPGGSAHAWAALLCFCLCLGCIPYMMTGFKDVSHRCSKCGALLATWHRSGRTEVHMHG